MFHSKKILIGLSFFAFQAGLSLPLVSAADNISVLGTRPRWQVLEKYQETITRDEFKRLIEEVYCTHGLPADMINIGDASARILMHRQPDTYFTLRFARAVDAEEQVPRLWRPASSLSPASQEKPLAGLRIALDPGHLGGPWAKMEERWFQVGNSLPVTEGDMTLKVARLVAKSLQQLGASISFVRNSTEPVTPLRPDDFKELARKILIRNGIPAPRPDVLDPADPEADQSRAIVWAPWFAGAACALVTIVIFVAPQWLWDSVR